MIPRCQILHLNQCQLRSQSLILRRDQLPIHQAIPFQFRCQIPFQIQLQIHLTRRRQIRLRILHLFRHLTLEGEILARTMAAEVVVMKAAVEAKVVVEKARAGAEAGTEIERR